MNRTQIARDLLHRATSHLEDRQRQNGAFNIMAATFAYDSSRLLNFNDLTTRLNQLLEPVTVGQLLDGAITSIAQTEDMNSRPLPRATLEEIERQHPLFHPSYVSAALTGGGAHLQACLSRDYERAFSLATTELEHVEIVLARALLGDFDVVKPALQRLPERKEHLLLVFAIELYRAGQFDEADEITSKLLAEDLTWAPTHLALGISERLPWQLYPFPDY